LFEFNELIKACSGRLVGVGSSGPVKGISIDTRSIKPGEAFIAIRGDNFDGHCFINQALKKGAACVIVKKAPDCRARTEAPVCFVEVADTVAALGDIARRHRQKFNTPVVAVTGSCGKTTAKEMIAAVLSGAYKVLKNDGTRNNHIGLPMTLLGLEPSHDFAVLELGSNHAGEIEYLARIARANIAVITNVGESHLQAFGNRRGVFKEKISLLRHLEKPRIAILNSDNPFLNRLSGFRKPGQNVFTYGMERAADFCASGARSKNSGLEFFVNGAHKFRLNTPGIFNIHNALAAIAVGRLSGMDYASISKRLSAFVFPRGRLNLIESGAVRFIDDTYNSNPFSLEQALRVLAGIVVKGRKIFVMGDMLELGSRREFFHRRAGPVIARVCDTFIGVGRLSKQAAASARRWGLEAANMYTCNNAAEARDILFNKVRAASGDIVLVKGSRAMKMEQIFEIGDVSVALGQKRPLK